MSSSYTSEYPDGAVFKTEYQRFFEEFYRISDTPDAHGEDFSLQGWMMSGMDDVKDG